MECWHLTTSSGTDHVKKSYKAQRERKPNREASQGLAQEGESLQKKIPRGTTKIFFKKHTLHH